ncbi:hypothetical protein V1502_07955 [Bacillus sp. SCS-153A]|uniref:hypothetical protein n=1 Tax=Rossellomorea sedimentorum TaxID=3115294 RepID=UPI003905BA99
MEKNGKRIAVILSICFILVVSLKLYEYRIIDEKYEKLTIIKTEHVVYVITDEEQVNAIVEQINTRPRSFIPFSERVQHEPMFFGTLIFEGNGKKKKLIFTMPKGNVKTKYWEIDTGFDFAADVNDNFKQKVY